MKGSFVSSLFHEEPVGTFALGHVVINAPDVAGADQDPSAGYWLCDIADHDRLAWSDKVYDMFGLSAGSPVTRDWAVARYTEPSRRALERTRTYALSRKLSFFLDAVISPEGGGTRWIRVLAIPILGKRGDRVVALHGLKRPL